MGGGWMGRWGWARFARAPAVALTALLAAAVLAPGCANRAQKEAEMTLQCKREDPCKNHGLCTGTCEGNLCQCIAARNEDCAPTMQCVSNGVCTARQGKCVIGSDADCQQAIICKAGARCTLKEGACAVGGDADCKQSELCKSSRKCVARGDACIDPTRDMAALLNPNKAAEPAPEKFQVKFVTSRGEFVIEAHKAWAPLGVERFYNLAKMNFYAETAFYRVIDKFIVHFGIHGNHEVSAAWRENPIRDDPPARRSNTRGTVSFAANGPHSRSTELFINLGINQKFDKAGFLPIGTVVQGMQVIEALNKEYGEAPPNGKGPEAARLQLEGASYLQKNFPNLDVITRVTLQ